MLAWWFSSTRQEWRTHFSTSAISETANSKCVFHFGQVNVFVSLYSTIIVAKNSLPYVKCHNKFSSQHEIYQVDGGARPANKESSSFRWESYTPSWSACPNPSFKHFCLRSNCVWSLKQPRRTQQASLRNTAGGWVPKHSVNKHPI